MAALEQDGGDGGQGVSEADHAHVVSILLETSCLVTTLETRQTSCLSSNATTLVATVVDLATGSSLVLLTLLLTAHSIQHWQCCTAGATTILAGDSTAAALLLGAVLSKLNHSFQC